MAPKHHVYESPVDIDMMGLSNLGGCRSGVSRLSRFDRWIKHTKSHARARAGTDTCTGTDIDTVAHTDAGDATETPVERRVGPEEFKTVRGKAGRNNKKLTRRC